MPQPTEHGMDTARAALAKASLFDPTTVRPDLAVIAAWAQLLDDIDPDEAVWAVDRHYATTTGRRVMPADILNLVRGRRQDQHLRGVVRRRELEAPRDPEASRRGYLAARAEVDAVLASAGGAAPDWSGTCRWCRSGPGQPCVTQGRPRATPHPSRIPDRMTNPTEGATP